MPQQRRGPFTYLSAMAGALALGSCIVAASPGIAQDAASQLASAYVVLGEDGAPVVRAITTAGTCPMLQVDGRDRPMSVRAPPETVPLRPTRSTPAESKPSAFPVLTCEATLARGAHTAMLGGRRLPLPPAMVRRIVVIGDTGCRIKASDNAFQACNDPKAYPFARISAAAAAWKPDLVVHVGDYLYRENACPDSQPGCAGSPWGYGWEPWQADFFTPAAPLLAAAPWILVRGNHESCNRAGQGWWRFLDPHPLVKGRDCNAAADDDTGDYSDPYAVPLGGRAQIVAFDSSNTGADAVPFDDIRSVQYRKTYGEIARLARQADFTFAADHHPLLGFAATQSKDGQIHLKPGNLGLQSAFGSINPWLVPPGVSVLLSGHVHVWQQVSFSSPHPTQFVAGFSGTQEDIVPLPARLDHDATPGPGAEVAHFSSWVDGFGFMTMERQDAKRWRVKIWDVDGHLRNQCEIVGRRSVCRLPKVR